MGVPAPAIAGAAVLAALCLAALALGFGSCSSPAFEVVGGAAASGASDDAAADAPDDAAADGEGQGSVTAGKGQGLAADAADAEASGGAAGDEVAPAAPITVHAAGAVASPGIYELAQGARVQDAVDAAGGFAEGAAQGAVNLARVLQDGEQVWIPTQEEADAGTVPRAGDGGASGTAAASSSAAGGLVNINTASIEELDTLPGVGPSTAQAIVDERESGGKFETVEDIQRVSGIGEKKYEKLKSSICV